MGTAVPPDPDGLPHLFAKPDTFFWVGLVPVPPKGPEVDWCDKKARFRVHYGCPEDRYLQRSARAEEAGLAVAPGSPLVEAPAAPPAKAAAAAEADAPAAPSAKAAAEDGADAPEEEEKPAKTEKEYVLDAEGFPKNWTPKYKAAQIAMMKRYQASSTSGSAPAPSSASTSTSAPAQSSESSSAGASSSSSFPACARCDGAEASSYLCPSCKSDPSPEPPKKRPRN